MNNFNVSYGAFSQFVRGNLQTLYFLEYIGLMILYGSKVTIFGCLIRIDIHVILDLKKVLKLSTMRRRVQVLS